MCIKYNQNRCSDQVIPPPATFSSHSKRLLICPEQLKRFPFPGRCRTISAVNILQAILIGIVEGMTEFLPVSSTYHILITTELLRIPQTEFTKFFGVFIQAGAILAVVALFGREWLAQPKIWIKVAWSFLPTAIIGYLLHDLIKEVFFTSFQAMTVIFITVGIVFLILEQLFASRRERLQKTIAEMTLPLAVVIGLAQALAVMPGVSRAGAVIIAMLLLGFTREDAAKYSFTLAVPTILAAAVLDFAKTRHLLFSSGGNEVMVLAAGTVAAFVSAFIVVKWFIGFVRQRTFRVFGWYRITAGAVFWWLVR